MSHRHKGTTDGHKLTNAAQAVKILSMLAKSVSDTYFTIEIAEDHKHQGHLRYQNLNQLGLCPHVLPTPKIPCDE